MILIFACPDGIEMYRFKCSGDQDLLCKVSKTFI